MPILKEGQSAVREPAVTGGLGKHSFARLTVHDDYKRSFVIAYQLSLPDHGQPGSFPPHRVTSELASTI
jgi:hypothetical protein